MRGRSRFDLGPRPPVHEHLAEDALVGPGCGTPPRPSGRIPDPRGVASIPARTPGASPAHRCRRAGPMLPPLDRQDCEGCRRQRCRRPVAQSFRPDHIITLASTSYALTLLA